MSSEQFTVVVPAAGVGKRMQADRPKQYLTLLGKTILEHTLETLISHPRINRIIVALDKADPYFDDLSCSNASWLTRAEGGQERADSVLAGLNAMENEQWVLVHDAARPCLSHSDLDKLLAIVNHDMIGGILATPVRDTMKRENPQYPQRILHTEEREGLWHALTPQLFPLQQLKFALQDALDSQTTITDEASAMEWAGHSVQLVNGSASNIKITRPEDLALAQFYLSQGNQ
jgi:2-C-methyl-D-erythritol 4-phosphate cytidylyltransferase